MSKTEVIMKAIELSELPINEVAFDALLKSIHSRGQTLQRDIHKAACFVLQHIEKHSDIRVVQKLLLAMPESARTNALRDWFTEYGPLTFEQNKPAYVKGKPTQLVKAMHDPFWKFSPETVYVPMNVVTALSAFIKKLQKDETELSVDHGVLISQLEGMKSNAIAPIMH